MDKSFNKYLRNLAQSEEEKSKSFNNTSRHKILIHSGVLLNWLGDYFANPKIKWQKKLVPIKNILMTGTSPEFNKIFIKQSQRSPSKLLNILEKDKKLKDKVLKWANKTKGFTELIILRKEGKYYKVLDGMHRFVKVVLAGVTEIESYVPLNEKSELPVCESHIVYDLIRGYLRNARDKAGQKQLEQSLMLLLRTYSNVEDLLKNRFNLDYVPEKDVQDVIKKVFKNY